jgi:hypothetical protein
MFLSSTWKILVPLLGDAVALSVSNDFQIIVLTNVLIILTAMYSSLHVHEINIQSNGIYKITKKASRRDLKFIMDNIFYNLLMRTVT